METFGSSFKRKVSKFSKKSQKTSEPPKIEIEEVELEPLETLNVQELPDIVQASSHSSVETQNPAPPVTNQQESLGLTLVRKSQCTKISKNVSFEQ